MNRHESNCEKHKNIRTSAPVCICCLKDENDALKEELFDKETLGLMEDCKRLAAENFELKAEIKKLKQREYLPI